MRQHLIYALLSSVRNQDRNVNRRNRKDKLFNFWNGITVLPVDLRFAISTAVARASAGLKKNLGCNISPVISELFTPHNTRRWFETPTQFDMVLTYLRS